MDRNAFSSGFPGKLAPIDTAWGADTSFTPTDLPPDWVITDDIWGLLLQAKEQLMLLEGIGRNLPNPAIILRTLRDREAILSSTIEGTYATPRELLLFELEPDAARPRSESSNQQREVYNYVRALEFGTSSNLQICERLIRELHQMLMAGVRGRDKTPGDFRKVPVAIGTSGRFIPPPPLAVPNLIVDLERYANSENRSNDPLVDAFLFHYQFEAIHPFQDGNGRVGRLLLTIMVQRECALSKPWLHMSEFYERNREEYYERLFAISTRNEWAEWVGFCLRGVAEQAKGTIERCERLLSLKEDFTRRLQDVGGHVRLTSIVENIFESPFIRVVEAAEKLAVSYPTASSDLERLVEAKILKQLPETKPKTFYSPEVFQISYQDLED